MRRWPGNFWIKVEVVCAELGELDAAVVGAKHRLELLRQLAAVPLLEDMQHEVDENRPYAEDVDADDKVLEGVLLLGGHLVGEGKEDARVAGEEGEEDGTDDEVVVEGDAKGTDNQDEDNEGELEQH